MNSEDTMHSVSVSIANSFLHKWIVLFLQLSYFLWYLNVFILAIFYHYLYEILCKSTNILLWSIKHIFGARTRWSFSFIFFPNFWKCNTASWTLTPQHLYRESHADHGGHTGLNALSDILLPGDNSPTSTTLCQHDPAHSSVCLPLFIVLNSAHG